MITPIPTAGSVRRGRAESAPLGVVIITYNSAEVLPGLLDSLESGLAGVDQRKILVVDNQSRDSSVAIAEQHPVGAQVVRSPFNGGYAAGINLAAMLLPSHSDLLVLNPDIRLSAGSVAHLVRRARAANVGIAVPLIRNGDGTLATSLRREPTLAGAWWNALLGPARAGRLGLGDIIADPDYYGQGRTVAWATGAALLVSARARRLVGDWD
jgi:GT2 family glycosyltransferase